jgi:hypothetical protein
MLAPAREPEPGALPETWEVLARTRTDDSDAERSRVEFVSSDALLAQWMADELSSSEQR